MKMLKQAKKMQGEMERIQKELAEREIEATAGGGMVTVVVTGALELVSIKIDPEVIDPEDVEMLEDLITAAVNEAMGRAREVAQKEMGAVTSGLGLNMPGLF